MFIKCDILLNWSAFDGQLTQPLIVFIFIGFINNSFEYIKYT